MKKINKIINLFLSVMLLNSCSNSFEFEKVEVKSLYNLYKLLFNSKLSVKINNYSIENRFVVKNKIFDIDYCDIFVKEIGKIKNIDGQLYKVELDYYLINVDINEELDKDYVCNLVRSIVYYSTDDDILEEVGYDIGRVFNYLGYISNDDFNELLNEKEIKVDIKKDNDEFMKINKIESEFMFIDM
ncbi:MAG: hypothetical protein E7177_01350 [Erysipelotrichaceae bacterium]|nr:hypothetical protein [Erysipelotrichaceae bacterium]